MLVIKYSFSIFCIYLGHEILKYFTKELVWKIVQFNSGTFITVC